MEEIKELGRRFKFQYVPVRPAWLVELKATSKTITKFTTATFRDSFAILLTTDAVSVWRRLDSFEPKKPKQPRRHFLWGANCGVCASSVPRAKWAVLDLRVDMPCWKTFFRLGSFPFFTVLGALRSSFRFLPQESGLIHWNSQIWSSATMATQSYVALCVSNQVICALHHFENFHSWSRWKHWIHQRRKAKIWSFEVGVF